MPNFKFKIYENKEDYLKMKENFKSLLCERKSLTHYHYILYNLLRNKNPIDRNCKCFVCQNYTRGYISHLIRAKEITGMKLVTFHNLYFFNTFVEEIRKKIKEGKI